MIAQPAARSQPASLVSARASGMHAAVRVATWNVNSIKARLPHLLLWLAARKPDIALLQELKVTDAAFPHDALRDAGYHSYTHAEARWNGVAVLTRQPATVEQAGLEGAESDGARLLTVRVGGLTATSLYAPNGKGVDHPDFPRKLAWLTRLGDYLEAVLASSDRVIVGGDFNVTPTDADTFDPEGLRGQGHHTEPERAALARLGALGLVDLYRHHDPDGRMFSWWDYRAGCFHKNLGLRIDLLLGSAPVVAAVERVFIDRDFRKKQGGTIPSDHAPVLADVAL